MDLGVLHKIYNLRLRSEEVAVIWPKPTGRGYYHCKVSMTEVDGHIFAQFTVKPTFIYIV